jgi:hypothetical protein
MKQLPEDLFIKMDLAIVFLYVKKIFIMRCFSITECRWFEVSK